MNCPRCGSPTKPEERIVHIATYPDGTVSLTLYYRTTCDQGHHVGDRLYEPPKFEAAA